MQRYYLSNTPDTTPILGGNADPTPPQPEPPKPTEFQKMEPFIKLFYIKYHFTYPESTWPPKLVFELCKSATIKSEDDIFKIINDEANIILKNATYEDWVKRVAFYVSILYPTMDMNFILDIIYNFYGPVKAKAPLNEVITKFKVYSVTDAQYVEQIYQRFMKMYPKFDPEKMMELVLNYTDNGKNRDSINLLDTEIKNILKPKPEDPDSPDGPGKKKSGGDKANFANTWGVAILVGIIGYMFYEKYTEESIRQENIARQKAYESLFDAMEENLNSKIENINKIPGITEDAKEGLITNLKDVYAKEKEKIITLNAEGNNKKSAEKIQNITDARMQEQITHFNASDETKKLIFDTVRGGLSLVGKVIEKKQEQVPLLAQMKSNENLANIRKDEKKMELLNAKDKADADRVFELDKKEMEFIAQKGRQNDEAKNKLELQINQNQQAIKLAEESANLEQQRDLNLKDREFQKQKNDLELERLKLLYQENAKRQEMEFKNKELSNKVDIENAKAIYKREAKDIEHGNKIESKFAKSSSLIFAQIMKQNDEMQKNLEDKYKVIGEKEKVESSKAQTEEQLKETEKKFAEEKKLLQIELDKAKEENLKKLDALKLQHEQEKIEQEKKISEEKMKTESDIKASVGIDKQLFDEIKNVDAKFIQPSYTSSPQVTGTKKISILNKFIEDNLNSFTLKDENFLSDSTDKKALTMLKIYKDNKDNQKIKNITINAVYDSLKRTTTKNYNDLQGKINSLPLKIDKEEILETKKDEPKEEKISLMPEQTLTEQETKEANKTENKESKYILIDNNP